MKPNRTEAKQQLNNAYKIMNDLLFDNKLPITDVHITEQNNDKCDGFFRHSNKEIYIGVNFVKEWDTWEMLNTLWHEMIHKYIYEYMGIADSGIIWSESGKQYHTELFRNEAVKHGGKYLTIPDESSGYSDIELTTDNMLMIMEAI